MNAKGGQAKSCTAWRIEAMASASDARERMVRGLVDLGCWWPGEGEWRGDRRQRQVERGLVKEIDAALACLDERALLAVLRLVLALAMPMRL